MKYIIFFLSLIPFLIWGSVRTANGVSFGKNCGGYLVRAANSNTVEMAEKELVRALDYIERNELTNGYTSVIYQTPDEDVGFWYNNIKSAKEELANLPKNSSPLEKTNVLMKLRESLTSQGESGSSVTVPEGISVYPMNTILFMMGWLSFIVMMISSVYIIVTES